MGDALVDITGWKMDDNSYAFGSAVALNGVTSIAAGESVVFVEEATTNNVAAFKAFWGGMSGKQVGTYSGSGVGLSSSADGVVVFDSTGNEINRVGFGAATT
ncbi:MAG: PEP-CTERM sorting domain-containing protein, partial [Verrucomicrobia bacterium]|nr:PEP-CTERM sorting domain-containing protein [Verrucomicrobiota bacterium]